MGNVCKILNPNNEVLHIRKNTIEETYEPIKNNDILTTFSDDTVKKEINDSELTSNINVVKEKPKRTLE